ncbi:4'-phosphopantetheinyl transferase [Streptomyces sp. NPDC059917]|uniref:4'-phosphopantetheinyl transferase family protein n=1 Tax=Streptomyces sp. NPDC059917 TaxID=3347002 RepID=UPI0036498917
MIEEILPAEVAAIDAVDEDLADLFAAERAAIGGAVPERRREFAMVRKSARTALGQLGIPPVPLVPGAGRAPVWPTGVVGSMTHCPGYRAAAVARSSRVHAVGIDAEVSEPLPSGVLQMIGLPSERAMLARLDEQHPEVPWDRLLFSCKESVYKIWYPLAGSMLEFDGAEVEIDPGGCFSARFTVEGPVAAGHRVSHLSGRWLHRDGLLLTGIALGMINLPGISLRPDDHSPRLQLAVSSGELTGSSLGWN